MEELVYRAFDLFRGIASEHRLFQVGDLVKDIKDSQKFFVDEKGKVRPHEFRRNCSSGCGRQVSTFCGGCSRPVTEITPGDQIAKRLVHFCYRHYSHHLGDCCVVGLDKQLLSNHEPELGPHYCISMNTDEVEEEAEQQEEEEEEEED